jgi:uncharacterized protein (DUF305 family)
MYRVVRSPAMQLPLSLAVVLFAMLSLLAGRVAASGPAPDVATSKYEIRFMEEMIDHHAMAAAMGTMCIDKAVHPELRALCTDIVAAQTQEIAVMQTWLASWYGVSHAPQMTRGDEQKMARMAALTPGDFEVAFLKSMIRHHWKAVIRATGCIDRAYHAELVALCEDIVIAQSAEIEQMRTWLCNWYGLCNYGPKGRGSDRTDD